MVNMRAPSFIRSLSSKLSMGKRSNSPAVVPVLEQSQFSQQVVTLLDILQSSEHDVGCASWLIDALDATTATQKLALEYLACENYSNVIDTDKELIDEYLEDNIELLDACNALVEKIDMIQKYVSSLRATTRLLDISDVTSLRAQGKLNECDKLEKRCVTLDKCGPKLHKLMGRKSNQPTNAWHAKQNFELNEIVNMSKEVALVTCHRLQRALSFKSKRGLTRMKSNISANWSNSLNGSRVVIEEEVERCKKSTQNSMMKELEEVVAAFRLFHGQAKSHNVNVDLDLMRRSCEALEEGMRPLEEKIWAFDGPDCDETLTQMKELGLLDQKVGELVLLELARIRKRIAWEWIQFILNFGSQITPVNSQISKDS
ncbi:hypothetical protein Cgig2_024921 [Carnegiea gigantea]|uniref:Uncharacterized protein n=1 Tax=Carnegiea gigantea TaxID=171969 RepID=A0A9Q1QGD9_9CARY|nr:hypothetical protein Cgig2_024921 [Carnegiea gigantea]